MCYSDDSSRCAIKPTRDAMWCGRGCATVLALVLCRLEGANRDGFDMSQFEHPGWGTLDADAAKAFAGELSLQLTITITPLPLPPSTAVSH